MGWDALGTDINPLAILISNAKIQALRIPGDTLEDACQRLAARLERQIAGVDCDEPFPDRTARSLMEKAKCRLPNESYLQNWFTTSVLIQLRLISTEIAGIADRRIRDVANVILSNILRDVSLQDPADLRIRRRSNPQGNYPAVAQFINLLRQRTQNVVAAARVLGTVRGRQRAMLGDSRRALAGLSARFDAVITSPPYATALPYLDTQRLSLAFLGLLSPKELRTLENDVIGNREISKSAREREEAAIKADSELPTAVRSSLYEGPAFGCETRQRIPPPKRSCVVGPLFPGHARRLRRCAYDDSTRRLFRDGCRTESDNAGRGDVDHRHPAPPGSHCGNRGMESGRVSRTGRLPAFRPAPAEFDNV